MKHINYREEYKKYDNVNADSWFNRWWLDPKKALILYANDLGNPALIDYVPSEYSIMKNQGVKPDR